MINEPPKEPRLRLTRIGKNQAQRLALLAAMVACIIIIATGASASREAHQGDSKSDQAQLSYNRDIKPILENNCYDCHKGTGSMADFELDTYQNLMKGGMRGADIVPGKSAESRLIGMLEGKIHPKMPPNDTLEPDLIAKIKTWIDQGAKESLGGDKDKQQDSKESPKPTGQVAVSFEQDIMPIFKESCARCHSAKLQRARFSLEDYDSLMKGGTHTDDIVPGKSDESRLVQMIEGKVKPKMPLGGSLTLEQIAKIRAWIDAGANSH